MHEAGAVAAILKEVAETARRHGARRVSGVRLVMGRSDHLSAQGLRTLFEAGARGTPAQDAELEIVESPQGGAEEILLESLRLEDAALRLRLTLYGAVQGVGYRPFASRLAAELGLSGWARNGPAGLVVEAEGPEEALRDFARRLVAERPCAAQVSGSEEAWLEPAGLEGFRILESEEGGAKTAWVLPDLAVCRDCLAEIADPAERRHGYPFTNCTQCGPRFTIVTGIPYDRAATTMAPFRLCAACAEEYAEPRDRRFHAQPIACPDCGPKLWLEAGGERRGEGAAALEQAAGLIRGGGIVALKGVGGFLLLCDARSSQAVRRLRERKRREEKPFALMFPSMEELRRHCLAGADERAWLESAAAPIVLLRRAAPEGSEAGPRLAPEIAPGNPRLGAMLPYAPLHRLLLDRLGFPIVATSGNLSEEPIATDNDGARGRLGGLADAFLMHDRGIARHADDSIVRLSRGRQSVLRRARGLAPLPLETPVPLKPVLALGGQLKSTVSIASGRRIITSQHLGDLEQGLAWDAFRRAVDDLRSLYGFTPELAACDLHPDYLSTRFAEGLGLPLLRFQHHHAHIAACMAEHGLEPPVLGVAWDGLGYGPDGTLWGGEFLRVEEAGYARLAHLRTFPLPGGSAALREPRRCALGLLAEAGLPLDRLEGRFGADWSALKALPASSALSPLSSGAGRLFDAAASLCGLRQVSTYEGQAAMALENALEDDAGGEAYPLPLRPGVPARADWAPLLAALLADADAGVSAARISARFHNALADLIAAAALRFGLPRVVLSGGVFQNAYLTEAACARLEAEGFAVYTHQRLPANDGGLSAGQAYLAGRGWGAELLEGG